MFCKHCNTQVPEGSAFCLICGTRIDAEPVPVADTVQEAAAPEVPQEQPKKPKSIKKFIIIGIAALLVIAILLVLWLEVFTVRVFLMTERESYGSKSTYEYDENGNKLVITIYMDGEPFNQHRYEYNEDNNPVSSKSYRYTDGEKTETTRTRYEYNDDGHLERTVTYSNGKKTGTGKFVCDEDGNILKSVFYDTDGSQTGYATYEYNSDGKEISYEHYSADGKLTSSEETTYDQNGNITKFVAWSTKADGTLYISRHYEETYDDNGNCITHRSFDENGEISYDSTYEYDSDDRLLEQVTTNYENGKKSGTRRTVYAYNEDGHPEKISYYNDGELESYTTVTCDDNGNPIKKVHYEANGEKSNTEYYEYTELRLWKSRAEELQESGADMVIIDEGWF